MKSIGLMSLWPPTWAGITRGASVMKQISHTMEYVGKALNIYFDVLKQSKQFTLNDIKKFNEFVVGKQGFAGSVIDIVDKLEAVGIKSAAKAAVISALIRPIFITIKDFMKVIEMFANMKYATEWDKDGHPIAYESITPQMFKDAAIAISSSFATFLVYLSAGMKTFDVKSIFAIRLLKDSIGPVMKSVATFTDAILAAVSASIPCEWDKEGKPIKFRQFDVAEFSLAATLITSAFVTFLDALGPALDNMPYKALLIINSMKDGIEPVMNAVGTYTDAIMSFVAGKEVEFTDEKGNTLKKLVEIDPAKFALAAENIATAFDAFLTKMSDSFVKYAYGGEVVQTKDGGWFGDDEYSVTERGNKVADLISGLTGIKDITESVGTLMDIVLKVIEEAKTKDLNAGVDTLTKPIIKFVDSLVAKFGSDEQVKKVENLNKGLGKLKSIALTYKQIFDVVAKIYTDHGDKYTGITQMLSGFINFFYSPEMLKSYEQLETTIDQTLEPLFAKFTSVIGFFDTMKIEHDGITYSMDLDKATTNTRKICKIINTFVKTIKGYQEISTDVNLAFIAKIAQDIDSMYVETNLSYQKYCTGFKKITEEYKRAYESKYKPIVNMLIRQSTNLYNIFVKLDRELINKEKQRNRALVNLKQHVSELGHEIGKVAENLKTVSENVSALKEANQELENARRNSTNETIQDLAPDKDTKPGATTPGKSGEDPSKKKDSTQQLIERMGYEVQKAVVAALKSVLGGPHPITITQEGKKIVDGQFRQKY